MTTLLTLTPVAGTTARRPGEIVELTASWDLPATPNSLSVLLSWSTAGKGNSDAAAISSQDIMLSGPKGEARVSVTLPQGPYSFSGRLISLQWKIELVANAKMASAWNFVLAPDGAEILLDTNADAPRLR